MRAVMVMVMCGVCACGKTTRNADGHESDPIGTGSGGTPPSTSEPVPPDECAPIMLPLDEESPLGPTGADLLDEAGGTHTLPAEYGAIVVDGLVNTEVELTVTPIEPEAGTGLRLVYQPCSSKLEIPVRVELATSDGALEASSVDGVIGYEEDGGYVHVRTELRGARPWSHLVFTPSSEVSPQLGVPQLQWVERQAGDLDAVFGAGEEFPAAVWGTFDALRWPRDCPHNEHQRDTYEQTEAALERGFDTLERELPLELNWQNGTRAELDLRIEPTAQVCEPQERAVEVSATSSDGRVAAVWQARAYERDSTWVTFDAVVSSLDALEKRLGVFLDLTGEHTVYGLRFSLRWYSDARDRPIGMLQVLGIDLGACDGDDESCVEVTEVAVATINKLGATVSSDVLSRDVTGEHGICPDPTVVLTGVGSPLLGGVIDDEPASLNRAALDRCNGGAPRLAFVWEAPGAGRFRFDTHGSTYDTVLVLRPTTAADECATVTGDACNDDVEGGLTSEITTMVNDGQRVRVEIASFGGVVQGASGAPEFQLNIAKLE